MLDVIQPTEPTPEEQPRRNYEAEALRDIAMADAGDTEALERVRGNMRYNKFLDERSTRAPETRESALGEMLCASQGLALPLMIKKMDELYGEDTARPVLQTRAEQERYVWQRFSGKQREAVEQHRALMASCERTREKLTDYISGVENMDAEDRANLPRLINGERLQKVEKVHTFMRTYIAPLEGMTDASDMLMRLDSLEDELFDAIGTDEESAQLVAHALMGWADRVKSSGRVTGADEFTVAVGRKLHNWAHHMDVYGKEMGVMAMYNTPGREGHWMTSEDIERQLEAHRHTQARRAEAQRRQNARAILRGALSRAVEISDNTGFLEGSYRTMMQMAGDSSLYLIPYAGAIMGAADTLVGGMTESVDTNNTEWIFDENAERPSEQGASVQAMQDAAIQVGVEMLPGGKVASKGLSAITRYVTGRAMSRGLKPGALTRWVINTTQKSTGRALLYEGAVSFVEEGFIEPLAQGLATMGSDALLDMVGIDHGQSRSMKEAFGEIAETWSDPTQVAALAMFTAALTGASYPGIRANVKWFQDNRNMWESLGLRPEVVDEIMAAPNPMQRGQEEVEKGWREDTEGMRQRMLEKARQMKRAGEVLVLTGQGSLDPELAPDSSLARAYSAVWQEYEREGLVPHVEAVENGQFKITEQQTDGTTMELVLNAEDADAYLQSAIDKADAKRVAATQARLGADQDAEIIDLREEIANAASVIAGTAALRQVEQTGEQHGLQIEDVTAGLPDEIATPIRNQGYVSLKDAQNISEYAMGVIQGLTQEGMNETDARMSKNEAAGMVRSWGYWADFAQNFAHREAMAGLAPGEGRSSISRTRGEHKVQIDGREVYGSSLMGVKGAVTHYGALEDVTESVFDMMVQKRAQVILENQAGIREAAGEQRESTALERQEAEKQAWQELGDIAKKARAAILKADSKAEIEEVVDGDRMSITEAFSTMALSKFITSPVLPTWMQSLGKALQANVSAGAAINTVRKAYAAAMRKDAKVMSQLDKVLEDIGVQVRDVFAEARIEQADIMAWKQARAATYAAMNGAHGVGGNMVTDALQQTQEEYDAIERQDKKQPVRMENPMTPSQLENIVRQGMSNAPKVTGSMAGVFEDDQGIYNPAGKYWMGLIDKNKLKDGIAQVKVGDKGKHGVIRGRELVGKFQASAAPLYVFKRKSGELTVMSGRHRFELMMRDTDCKAHPCYVFEESEEFDERWARMMDYENNMRDDQADELTAATYVRETGYDDSILREKGLMRNESRSKTGAFIGRHASEELFVRFKNRALGKNASENAKNAYTICQLTYTIKDRKRIEDIQTRCAMLLEQGKSWEYIGAVSQLLANKERVVERQGLLDLGADFEEDMERMAKFVEKNLQLLKESIDVIKQSKKLSKEKRAQAERLGITTATSAENEQMLSDLNELKAQFEAIGSFPELIAQAQMWDGVTPLDPVGLYLARKEEEQRRREEEGNMGADEYLEGQIREIVDDGTPDLFSAEMKGMSQPGHIEKNVTMARSKARGILHDQGKPSSFAMTSKALKRLDADYLEAVKSGDMGKAARMVREYAALKGYTTDEEWRMMHRAPAPDGYKSAEERVEACAGISVLDMADGFTYLPGDYWENGWMYSDLDDAAHRESFHKMREALQAAKAWRAGKRKSEPLVRMYRAMPKDIKGDNFINGDWLTPSRLYAVMHGQSNVDGGYRIVERAVPVSQVYFNGDDICEWGYDDGHENAYANTRNNVKRIDPVIYEEDGSIRPLSKRFNRRESLTTYLVIGKNAKTWKEYAKKAFRGRDDGKKRAELHDYSWRLTQPWREMGIEQPEKKLAEKLEAFISTITQEERDEMESILTISRRRHMSRMSPVYSLNDAEEKLFTEIVNKHRAAGGVLHRAEAALGVHLPDHSYATWLKPQALGYELIASSILNLEENQALRANASIQYIGKLGDIFNAPELFAAYPQLKNIRVERHKAWQYSGFYSEAENLIALHANLDEAEVLEVLLHEIQHAVQGIEGFARGGNPESARWEVYKNKRDAVQNLENAKDTLRFLTACDKAKGVAEQMLRYRTMTREEFLKQPVNGSMVPTPWGNLLDGGTNREASIDKLWTSAMKRLYMQLTQLTEERNTYDGYLLFMMPPLPRLEEIVMGEVEVMEQYIEQLNLVPDAHMLVESGAIENPNVELLMQQYEKWANLERLNDHELYRRLAGEQESRNVEMRRILTPEQREQYPFNDTLEYKAHESIVTYNVIGPNAQTWKKYAKKAYKGRDDRKLRAEIDASQAKLIPFEDAAIKLYHRMLAGELNEAEMRLIREFDALGKKLDAWYELAEQDASEEELNAVLTTEDINAYESKKDRVKLSIIYRLKSAGAVGNDTGGYGSWKSNDRLLRALAASLISGKVNADVESELRDMSKRVTAYELGDILDYPELFEAYPRLRRVHVGFSDLGANLYGRQHGNWIDLNTRMETEEDMLSTLLHEVQHVIQDIEGFARGGNTRHVYTQVKNMLEATKSNMEHVAEELRWFSAVDIARDLLKEARMLRRYPNAWKRSGRRFYHSRLSHSPAEIREAILRDIAMQYEKFRKEDTARTLQMDMEDYVLPVVHFFELAGIEKGIEALGKLKSRKLAFRGVAAMKSRHYDVLYKQHSMAAKVMAQYDMEPYELYRRLAGEIEARNVQARLTMRQAERDSLPFNLTLEHKGEAIVTYNVIGKKAKTWKNYVAKAFKGRDDGAPRAEIDASQAKLKQFEYGDSEKANIGEVYAAIMGFKETTTLHPVHRQALDILEAYEHDAQKIASQASPEEIRKIETLAGLWKALVSRLAGRGIQYMGSCWYAIEDGLYRAFVHPTRGNIKKFMEHCTLKVFAVNKLEDVLDYPELFEAYPRLKRMPVRWFKGQADKSGGVTYMPENPRELGYIRMNSNRTEAQILNTMVHELQHVIQRIEGFPIGGTSGTVRRVLTHMGYQDALDKYDNTELYRRLSGEVEARAAAERRTMTEEEREATPFAESMEYPGESFVVKRDDFYNALNVAGSFQMEKATMAGLHLLQTRADEQQGELLAKEWKRLAEQWATMGGDEGYRLGSGAKFLGELNALISATRNVLPEKYARMGRFNGLMRWAAVYAQMMQDGKVPRQTLLKGAIYQKFIQAMSRRDEQNRLNGMTDTEAKEALAVIAGERLDAAMDKVVTETIYRLELFLKDRERERIDWIVQRAYPKREAGQKWPRGKMDADSYRRMERAYDLMGMEANAVAKLIEGLKYDLEQLDPEEENYAEQEEKLEDELFLAHTFGCWENMGVEQARRACGVMVEMVTSGRTSWKRKLDKERRRADFTRMIMANNFTTPLSEMQATRQEKDSKEKSDNLTKVKKFGMGFMSYSQLMVALRKKLGAEFADRHLRLIAEAHEKTLCFQNELHTWLYDTLHEITGLDNEKDIGAWVNSNNQTEHTGIYLNIPVRETISITAEDAKVWLALTPEQRQERRDRLMEEAKKNQEKPVIPGEDVIHRLEDMVKQNEAKGRTPEHYSLVTEYSYKSEIVATKEAMMFAILTFEQPDYAHLMVGNGLSISTLQQLREYVGKDVLRWGYAMRKKLSEHGKLLAEVYEAYNGVPFAHRENYFRGMFDISTLKDRGDNPGQSDANGGIGCGKYGILTPRQYHNQKINWMTSATTVFIGTMKEQNNYICTSHITREWKTLLSHPLFEKRLRAELGDAALTLITGWTKMLDGAALADMRVNALMNRLFGKLLSAYAVSRLAGNVYSIVKQVSALLHGLVGGLVPTKVIENGEVCKTLTYHRVGFGDYLVALSKAMTGTTDITLEEIQQAAYIRGRKNVRGRKIERATMLTPNEKVPSKLGRTAELVSETAMDAIHYVDVKSNTRAGLALAEVVYQKAKAENKDGLVPDEELRRVAIQTAGLMVDRVAQPRLRTQQNFWTAGGGWAGCLGNFLTMFKSETLAKLGEYIALAMNGQYARLGTAAFSYGLLNALILALVDWMRGYGDDDEDAAQWWLTLGTNIVFNDLGSVPVFGTGVEWVKHKIAGGYMPQSSPMEMVVPYSDLWKYTKQVYRNVEKDASWDKHLNSLTGLMRTLGGASGWAQNSTVGPLATASSLTLAAATLGNLTRFGRDVYKRTGDEDETQEAKPARGRKQPQIVE